MVFMKKRVVVKCCICGREKTESGWKHQFRQDTKNIYYSHGFCPACHKEQLRQVRGLVAQSSSGSV
jgi:Zn finger protein HypA/HybF involved in hydrogenase expression